MTDGLLENIIQLEKRLQVEMAAEQVRAEAWKQRELATVESSFATAQYAEEERYKLALAREKAELKSEGAALEATSSAWCQRLSKLGDAILSDVLKRHLAAILPGGDHDHPNGQS